MIDKIDKQGSNKTKQQQWEAEKYILNWKIEKKIKFIN
jgi:hypothetical protein